MKKCPICGNPMEDEELFCANCGAKYVEPEPAPAPAAPAFCRSCGERLEPDAVFCPNCGSSVQAPPPPAAPAEPVGFAAPGAPLPDLDAGAGGTVKEKKKSKGRLIAIIGGAVGLAAVIAVAAVILVNTVFTSPAKKFLGYQEELLMDGAFKAITDAADKYNDSVKFSTDMTITADCRDALLRSVLRDSSVVLKVDLDKDSLLANGELNIMGSKALTGTLTYGDGKIGICLPEADPTYYVGDIEALAYRMGGSDLDKVSGLSDLEIPKIPTSSLKKLGSTYYDILTSAVTKENVQKSDRNRIRLDELHQTLTGDVYIFEPKAEDIEEMLIKLAEQLETDKELRGFVKELVGENAGLLDQMGNVDIEDEFDKALVDAAKELKRNARDAGRALERSGFVWTVGVADKKVSLNKIEMDNGNTVLAMEMTDGKAVFYVSSYGSVQGKLQVDYEKTKDGLYEGTLTVGSGYDSMTVAFEELDLKNKSILGIPYGSFSMTVDGDTVKLEVSKSDKSGTDHTITVPEFYVSGYGYLSDLEITIHTTDKKSTASKPKEKAVDVSSYSERELAEIAGDIASDLERALSELGGDLLYGSLSSW